MPQPSDQVYVNRVSHADCMYLNTVGLKWCFTPGVFLPEIHNLALIMKRTLKKNPLMERPVTKHVTSTQNCQGHQKLGKSEQLSQGGGASVSIGGVASHVGSWARKRALN